MATSDLSSRTVVDDTVYQFNFSPFTRTQMRIMGFLFGPIAAGLAAGMNWQRLSKPQRFWQAFFIGVGVTILMSVVQVFFFGSAGSSTDRSLGLLFSLIFGSGLAVSFSRQQEATYNTWEAERYRQNATELSKVGWSSFIVVIVTALVLNIFYNITIWPALFNFVAPIVYGSRGDQTYEDSNLKLTYDGVWLELEPKKALPDVCNKLDCRFILSHSGGTASIYMIRFKGSDLSTIPLDTFTTEVAKSLRSRTTRLGETESLLIDKHEAVRQQIDIKGGTEYFYFIREKPDSMLRIEIYVADGHQEKDAPVGDAIVQSIQFK